MKKPVIALVGRPNVGKSTLFNRLTKSKEAIIEDTPGVTRDRIYGTAKFLDYSFLVIDTGGIEITEGGFNAEIKGQAELAIDQADVVLFVVDGKEGLTTSDYTVRDILLKSGKRIIVVINKADSRLFKENEYDFYSLGFDEYVKISAEQNTGIYDLLETITKDFNKVEEEYDKNIVKFSIIGRPNVGKSSLVNALLNEERVIVSEVAGTTRDAVYTQFAYHNQDFVVIDTAGMRKKGKVYENIEKVSVLRSLKAIERSDVCVLVINAEEGIIEHDKHIASYAISAGKAIVIVVNKWDLVENKDEEMKKWIKDIRNNFQFMPYANIVFLSSKTKTRIHTLMPEIIKAYESATREVKTSALNDCIREAVAIHEPPSYKGKRLKIYFVHQDGTMPPKFEFSVNNKKLIHFSYERYLENQIRENFDFTGTPIIFKYTNRGEKDE